jgi:hypothetical protein
MRLIERESRTGKLYFTIIENGWYIGGFDFLLPKWYKERLNNPSSLVIRKMSKLTISRYNITKGIDIFDICTSILVSNNTSSIHLDIDILESDISDIWSSTKCEENMGI